VKIIEPSPLLGEAADVLAAVRGDVVVVGAVALEVALAGQSTMVITPTRDIDVVVSVERAGEVVALLEAADLRRSDVDYERGFTWVRGDLKVQLVRAFHPFPKPPARALPGNPVFAMAAVPAHQVGIAFPDNPDQLRLVCANAACLLALKQAAFGRPRPPDNSPVERDYHDAYLLTSVIPEELMADLTRAEHEVRSRATDALEQLGAGEAATIAAARQMVRLGDANSQRSAEASVRRAAGRALRMVQQSQ
jgi:hypothetical protein